jgi:signal transduction histidine kinase
MRMPAGEPLREPMERALELADEVMIESRDRVKGLRDASGVGSRDLSQDIEDAAKSMMAMESDAQFSVKVHGSPCPLHLVTHEDVFFIVREAVANAFKHAAARNIGVDLLYERTKLRITVRDDGCGIPAHVIESGGADGHWGLVGMRERAGKINAALSISNLPGSGAEVQLTVPAGIAYERERAAPGRFRFWGRRDRLTKVRNDASRSR